MRIKSIILLTLTCILSACTKHEYFHGYSFDAKELESLEVGQTSEQETIGLLGSPTTISDFGDKTYYYISTQQQSEAFFIPNTIAQEVLEISFDQKGKIKNIASYSLKEARNVNYASGTTQLKGNKLTPLEQIFSNIGKFNKPKQHKISN